MRGPVRFTGLPWAAAIAMLGSSSGCSAGPAQSEVLSETHTLEARSTLVYET